MKDKVFTLWARLLHFVYSFICRYILRNSSLSKQKMIPIGASLEDAIALYGNPIEEEPSEEAPGEISYAFDLIFHEVVVGISEDRITSVTYWTGPEDADPDNDLRAVLDAYAEGMKWSELTPGYSAVRSDGRRRVNFSAVPAIGVMEVDYSGFRDEDSEAGGEESKSD